MKAEIACRALSHTRGITAQRTTRCVAIGIIENSLSMSPINRMAMSAPAVESMPRVKSK